MFEYNKLFSVTSFDRWKGYNDSKDNMPERFHDKKHSWTRIKIRCFNQVLPPKSFFLAFQILRNVLGVFLLKLENVVTFKTRSNSIKTCIRHHYAYYYMLFTKPKSGKERHLLAQKWSIQTSACFKRFGCVFSICFYQS